MEHLTVEEMIAFVSARVPDDDFIQLAGKVNSHIYFCKKCREQVRAFQRICDALGQEALQAMAPALSSSDVQQKADGAGRSDRGFPDKDGRG